MSVSTTGGQKRLTLSLEEYNKVQLTLGQMHGEANALARKAAQIAQFLDDRIIEIGSGPAVGFGATESSPVSQSTSKPEPTETAGPTTTTIQAGPQ